MSNLILPYKPFTLEEVSSITGASAKMIDEWTKTIMPIQTGEDGLSKGLTYMQTFAVFVGWKWLSEGSDSYRAATITCYIGQLSLQVFDENLAKGCNFPVIVKNRKGKAVGTLIPAPDKVLSQRLRLDKLFAEFKANIARAFPNG